MKDECHPSGLFKSKAHHFEGRYDEEFPVEIFNGMTKFKGDAETLNEFRKRTYVCDICTKCGAVVKREE